MKDGLEKKENYSPGYGEHLISSFQSRSVKKELSFLYPHFEKNYNILDCGCGPGSISVGIAQYVKDGFIHAIDIEEKQVEKAKRLAKENDVTNIAFSVASIYKLPFEDSKFDMVFAHAVFQHLKDPKQALEEMYRVLKPGGIVAVRDDDQDSLIIGPKSKEMDKVIYLLKQCLCVSGGNPMVGKEHKRLLNQAGFVNVIGSASCECDGIINETIKRADIAIELLKYMEVLIVKEGWADKQELEKLIKCLSKWGNDPDAYDVITWCEAVGWKEK